MEAFYDYVCKVLKETEELEKDNLKDITKGIVDRMEQGGKFFVFGTGHSHMIGEEFYARAGGLANVHMIAPLELTLSDHPLKSTMIERISEYAEVVIKSNDITSKDMIMICSNSGRNGLPIELAARCNEMGCATIAFTNLRHSRDVSSRHQSGKRLFEICHYVIDNHGAIGDANIELEGVKGKMGATSTIVGAYIAQTLGILIAQEMVNRNIEPPVFVSSNLDQGDKWNKEIMEKHYGIY